MYAKGTGEWNGILIGCAAMDFVKKRRYGRLVWIGLFLLVLDIFLPVHLDINRLSPMVSITIAFDWMGMFVLLIIFNSCLRGRKTKSRNSFVQLLVVTFFILFFEVGVWTIDGLERHRVLNYLTNIACNSLMLVSAVLFFRFLSDSLDINRQRIWGWYEAVIWMAAAGIAAEIFNYWFGYFYIVDGNGTYHSNPIGIIVSYIPFLFIGGVSCGLSIKQKIPFQRKWNYLSYVLIPIGISLLYNITGMPLTLYNSLFISLLTIYGNIYIRQGQEIEQSLLENARKDAQLAWQRNQLTRSQIKPHFIFNCLGSIEQLCRMDPDRAAKATNHFAKYLRVNMDAMGEQSLVPFSKELEHIHHYIWLEQMRFGERLGYEEEIETTDFYLPPLSVQPIVENSVKHGMVGKFDIPTKISVSVHETEDVWEIRIEDDGAGFDVNEVKNDGRSHIGIQNVRESLMKMVNGEMTVSSRIECGTTVVIRIPKKNSMRF